MQAYIRPLCEGSLALRALMKSALPLLNNAVASLAVSSFRVWESRSDLSCHQRDHTSHRAAGYLNLLMFPSQCHPLSDLRRSFYLGPALPLLYLEAPLIPLDTLHSACPPP